MLRWIADDLGIPEPSPAELLLYLLEALGLAVAVWILVIIWMSA